jgi:hypothetical protein
VDTSEAYIRVAINYATVPALVITWLSGTTTLGSLRRNAATGFLELYIGTTLSGTGGISVALGTWYLLELHVKINNSTGILEFKVDGVLDSAATISGDTQPAAITTINIIRFHATTNTGYYDDIAINNVSGSEDISWPGDGRIVALTPSDNGYSSQWTGSDGDSTDNYQLIDEKPPSDADYVRVTTGSGLIDGYSLSTFDLSGSTIGRVWTNTRAKSDSAGDWLYHGVRSGSVNYFISGSLPTSFGTLTSSGSGWKLNPNTSASWTQSDIDDLQAIIQSS